MRTIQRGGGVCISIVYLDDIENDLLKLHIDGRSNMSAKI